VRDDRPFGGWAPPAALYYASRDRRHEHPARHLEAFTGILQADAYSGYNELYDPLRAQGAITAALCWAHARRQFFELADIAANARRRKGAAALSPVALEAVKPDRHTIRKSTRPAGGLHVYFHRGALGDCHWS
jgi:transposase